MRTFLALSTALLALFPAGVAAQRGAATDSPHVAVESRVLVLDQDRLSRAGVGGISVASEDAGVSVGRPGGSVRVGSRVGGLEVATFLDLVRSRRAVRQETTQKLVVLSGAPARLASQSTLVDPWGAAVTAGPELWIEPTALADGRVHLRLWTAVGEVRPGPFGTLEREVPVEASTEIVVPSGTPVVVATTDDARTESSRELLRRGTRVSATRSWIVVTPRVVADPGTAFELPEGLPAEWLES